MLRFENLEVFGFEAAIRGMRNPMNSWDKSDSYNHSGGNVNNPESITSGFEVGPNDLITMKKLSAGGPVHGKFKRMIAVYVDITAPLYWWKEFDTYKVGTVANSCSTMHKIHDKEFVLDDFSHEHLIFDQPVPTKVVSSLDVLTHLVSSLNIYRKMFNSTGDKQYWWQMIQLLPSSYNQRRTVMLNYEVLTSIYRDRRNHKLDEWHVFCSMIDNLPCNELITAKPTYV